MDLLIKYQFSLFRPVNAGYFESDWLNRCRFHSALQKNVFSYMKNNKENPMPDELKVSKNEAFIKCAFYGALVSMASLGINRQSRFLAFLAGGFTYFITKRRERIRRNSAFQLYIMNNFDAFKPEIQQAIESGDARYLYKEIDQTKSISELWKEIDRDLFFW